MSTARIGRTQRFKSAGQLATRVMVVLGSPASKGGPDRADPRGRPDRYCAPRTTALLTVAFRLKSDVSISRG